jgi:hypothetical protein
MSHIQKRADRRYRARWLDPDGRERPRTFNASGFPISNHIDGTKIGSMRLAAVRPSQVQAWVSDRAKVLSRAPCGFLWRFCDPSLQRPCKIGWWRPAP